MTRRGKVADIRSNARQITAGEFPGGVPATDDEMPAMPVTPLGRMRGVNFYLDERNEFVELSARDHSRLHLMHLFGRRIDWLFQRAPRFKDGKVTGWQPEVVAQDLMQRCAEIGIWDPGNRVRERGAWRGEDGELLLHLGDRVLAFPPVTDAWRQQRSTPPGVIGRYVYPGGEALLPPAPTHTPGGPSSPADRLLTLLETWSWRRADIDAILLLGWIGSAMIGGALNWRPSVWLTGGKGTGKSTLQKLLVLMFSEDALLSLTDTSGAAVWQTVKRQSLPVAVDELEAEADNRKVESVIKLMRISASGGVMARGGQDHKAVTFTLRSAFAFSSILIPPLTSQDRSRLAILEMDNLPPGAKAPKLEPPAMRVLGQQLRRRIIDNWHRFDATLEHFSRALNAEGHNARSCDQLGTLLTMADLLLHDGEPDRETTAAWTGNLGVATLAEADEVSDQEMCLHHLLSSTIEPFRGGTQKTIAQLLRIAAGMDEGEQRDAADALGKHGIKILAGVRPQVAIANYHTGLSRLYFGTHWGSQSGKMGVFVQSLRRLPGAERAEKPHWFAGVPARCTIIPTDVVIPSDGRRGLQTALVSDE